MNATQILIVQQAIRHLTDYRLTFRRALSKAEISQFKRLENTLNHLELIESLTPSELQVTKERFQSLEGGVR